jgi:hypothetical protein
MSGSERSLKHWKQAALPKKGKPCQGFSAEARLCFSRRFAARAQTDDVSLDAQLAGAMLPFRSRDDGKVSGSILGAIRGIPAITMAKLLMLGRNQFFRGRRAVFLI